MEAVAGAARSPAQNAQAVLLRQHNIQQHQVGQFLLHCLPKLGRPLKAGGIQAAVIQCIRHQFSDIGVILYQINQRNPSLHDPYYSPHFLIRHVKCK